MTRTIPPSLRLRADETSSNRVMDGLPNIAFQRTGGLALLALRPLSAGIGQTSGVSDDNPGPNCPRHRGGLSRLASGNEPDG